jgi:hypothetical protein
MTTVVAKEIPRSGVRQGWDQLVRVASKTVAVSGDPVFANSPNLLRAVRVSETEARIAEHLHRLLLHEDVVVLAGVEGWVEVDEVYGLVGNVVAEDFEVVAVVELVLVVILRGGHSIDGSRVWFGFGVG